MRYLYYALVALAMTGLLLCGSCCSSDDEHPIPGATSSLF